MGRYIPEQHTGTREQVVLGLLREWVNISQDGFMRLHAQEREMKRIEDELLGMGLEIRVGMEDEDGWFYAIKLPHGHTCTGEDCKCDPEFKIWKEEGFENGVGHWVQQDVYGTVRVGDPRYSTVGRTAFGSSVNGPWYTTAVTGKEWVWVGPPSPVPVPKPDEELSKTFASQRPEALMVTPASVAFKVQTVPSLVSKPPPAPPTKEPEPAPFGHLVDVIADGLDLINDYDRMYADMSCGDGRVDSDRVDTLLIRIDGALRDEDMLNGSVRDFFVYLNGALRSEDDDGEELEEDEDDGDDW